MQASQNPFDMWLPLLLLLPLGIAPISTTPLEDREDRNLKPPRQDVGQKHRSDHPGPVQSSAMSALHEHVGLLGAGMLRREADDAHGQGGTRGNQEVDVLKSSLGQDDAQKGEELLTQPPVINIKPFPSLHSEESEEAPCFAMAGGLGNGLKEALSALQDGWSRESELGRDTLTRFGICTGRDGSAEAGLSALATLIADRDGDSVGPWASNLDKELWVPGEEAGSVSLTFEVPPAFEVRTHLSTVAPTMLLFFVASKRTEILEVTFSSDVLFPNKQTACLSVETQFIVLTRRVPETGSPRLQTIRITVELKQPNRGPNLSLSEVQNFLMRRGKEEVALKRPLLVFFPNKSPHEDKPGGITSTDHSAPSPVLPPSRTYQFLCELQRFLSDVLPQKKALSSPDGNAVALPLASLSSMPPLTLGESSSESLLLGLLNSSTPTLFSFPQRGSGLLSHRVALSLQPPLLSMLRQGLDDALAQFRHEEVGGGHLTDRLKRLSDLSALPAEGMDQSGGDGESGEVQYCALLLLKALQTVLGTWEAERSQRLTRGGGEESQGKHNPCRLQSLTISLEAFLLEPSVATINNCEGECSFPLPKGNNHAILINSMVQKGGWTGRAPCCVPTEYGDLLVVELDKDGTTISAKTNMVAKECGCR
ncbi:muellerian-inhibiting factor [Alosa sapidissima]|uniref:muellerian-inhibiting factor n=1 Tax=Alosa sapidissima TaxID=34773 RepID=UPI001C096803|nr:muellerian-inhibiting factor [Alosa sapidissima]